MLFNSMQFVFFLPVVIVFFYALPGKYRNIMLLAASYYFYMCWKAEYLVLIVFSTLIDYYCGIQIHKQKTAGLKKLFLMASLVSNLGLLFSFKYFNFFNESLRQVFHALNLFYDVPSFNVLLPVGISFYTFQTLSYSISIYKGQEVPERNFITFALYVTFFPQLVAGPIERSQNLVPQLKKTQAFSYLNVSEGLRQVLWGFFKKLVVADRLAVYANTVFNNPGMHNGTTFLVANLFFAIQLYCDFSGYSDIAIGSARLMGIRLLENFRRPFFSKSIGELWRRWHMTLNNWFRDYVYIPMGGNRVSTPRWYTNILIVWLISGLWHGAGWNFVIWGGLNGLFIVMSIALAPVGDYFSRRLGINKTTWWQTTLQVAITFLLFYSTKFFFRANSAQDAFTIIHKVFAQQGAMFIGNPANFIYSIMAIVMLFSVEWLIEYRQEKISLYLRDKWYARHMVYALAIAIIFSIGVFDSSQFIYFQF
ncbi:MAG: MBOAT family protein [Bacteroidales bacterium]|nr:MBOAT family protein [Bacteroidales bacterium]